MNAGIDEFFPGVQVEASDFGCRKGIHKRLRTIKNAKPVFPEAHIIQFWRAEHVSELARFHSGKSPAVF